MTATVTFQERGYCRKPGYPRTDAALGWLRWLYNTTLAERKTAREERSESVTYLDRCGGLPRLRKAEPEQLGSLYGRVLEAKPSRVDMVFEAFFRRVEAGDRPGYPRFEPASRFRAIECLRPRKLRARGNGRYLLRIMCLPREAVKPRQELPGIKPKFVRIARTDWASNLELVFDGICKQPLAPSESAAAIGLGVTDQRATGDGERLEGVDDSAHRKTVRKRQRAVARCRKGSRTRRNRVRSPGKAHGMRHLSKRNACDRTSPRLVRRHGTLVDEDLPIHSMPRSANATAEAPGTNGRQKAGQNRSLPRQSRGSPLEQLADKPEWAGRRFERVNPGYTSQRCHRCGEDETRHRQGKPYASKRCGFSRDADVSVAISALQAVNSPAVASNRGNGRGAAGIRLSRHRALRRSVYR